MSTDIPSSLRTWLASISLGQQTTVENIQSGVIVNATIQICSQSKDLLQLQSDDRQTNWTFIIQELMAFNIEVDQSQKQRIIDGQTEPVFHILESLKSHYQKQMKQSQVDINKLDTKKNPKQAASLLELMILVIMKNFNLNSKEAVALLSNDSKYLAHLLAKGLKGKFQPIQNFIIDLKRCVDVIQNFCRNKQNQAFFLKSIKPGPISKSERVAQESLQLILLFVAKHHHKYELLKDQLINTFVLGIRRHPSLSPLIVSAILNLSNYNKTLLQTIKQNSNAADYQGIVFQIWKIGMNQQKSETVMVMKGFDSFVENMINNLANSELILSSLSALINFCQLDSNIFIDGQRGAIIYDNISQVQLSKPAQALVLINLLFALLSFLGKDKNSLAPAIYKLLIEKYQKCRSDEQAKLYIENFNSILEVFPSIPSTLIIESMNVRAQSGLLDIKFPQVNLFKRVINSEIIDLKNALIIYNIISRTLLEDPSLGLWIGDFISTIVNKYSNEEIIIDMTLKLLKVCLAIHYANVKKIVLSKRSVTGGSKGPNDEIVLMQIKNITIQEFIKKILQLNLKELNSPTQPLLTYSYIQVSSSSRELAQGLFKLLKILGDPQELISKYTVKEDQDIKNQRGKSVKESPKRNRYDQNESGKQSKLGREIGGSGDQINLLTRKKGLSGNSNSPMYISHLSAAGVQADAQKGLQKYHKVYLQKIERIQQEKAKKQAQQDKNVQLKKLFQRRLHQIGISARPNQVAQCIYQFNFKEKKMQEERVKGKIDIPEFKHENQQQRDLKVLDYFMKKYNRALKVYFNQYLGVKKIGANKNFDQIAEKSNLIEIGATWKMLKDHTLDEFVSLQQTKYVARKVNYYLKKDFIEPLSMDFEGFQQFIVQISFAMFTRPPKDLRGHPVSEMVDQTFSRFRLYASENKMDPLIFEEPQSIYYNETEAVKELNRKLEDNPNYIVPEGYKKIVEKKVDFAHQIFLEAMSPSYKQVIQVLDEILFAGLKFHIIQPFSTQQTVTRARPSLYYLQRVQNEVKIDINLSFHMKKEVARIPIKDRQIAKQAAGVLEEIVWAVQMGHTRLGRKLENKVFKDKKKFQDQIRQKNRNQQKKRQQRDKQLKVFIEQQKQKITEKRKQQSEKKKQDRKKQADQKKKRQKQEEQLKKKVEQYKNKKKQQEKKMRVASKQRQIKERQQFERKRKQTQQIKRKIQEHNAKKAEQQKQKQKQKIQQQKKRREQERKKYEQKQKEAKQKVQEYKLKKSSAVKGDTSGIQSIEKNGGKQQQKQQQKQN